MENNRFYVYIYKRKDNGNVFYIGKGTSHRDKDIKYHNNYCVNICEKYGVDIERVQENLTEQQALQLEKDLIKYYTEELGYSIALDGKRDRSNDKFLCNHTLGGDGNFGYCGLSEEQRNIKRQKMLGENNIAKKEEVRQKLSDHAKKHNSFTLPEVREKLSKNSYMKTEEGKQRASERMKKYYQTEEGKAQIEKLRLSKIGKSPSNCIKVKCEETNEIFDSITKCAESIMVDRRYLSSKLQKSNIVEITSEGRILHITKIPIKE